ncbi:MAG: hypothetical protein LAT52_12450, partial [Balneolales bacterium]|nr:hypothetical protein [Balneolales bacterium]
AILIAYTVEDFMAKFFVRHGVRVWICTRTEHKSCKRDYPGTGCINFAFENFATYLRGPVYSSRRMKFKSVNEM